MITKFSKCPYCDTNHSDRPYNSKNRFICKTCVPLTNEESNIMKNQYKAVSRGFITYDDTLPVYFDE